MVYLFSLFFFFKQKTAYEMRISDWSSDVCSSDLTDVFYKVDDENYLILFTRLGRQEAAFKAKVIADEIQKLVVGELPAGHEVIVSSTVAEVDRSLVLQKVNSLQDLVEYVRTSAAADRKSTRLNSSH